MGIFTSTAFSTMIRLKNGPFRETGIFVGPDSRYYVKHAGGYVPMTASGDTGVPGLKWYNVYADDDSPWSPVVGVLSYLYTPTTGKAFRNIRMTKGLGGVGMGGA